MLQNIPVILIQKSEIHTGTCAYWRTLVCIQLTHLLQLLKLRYNLTAWGTSVSAAILSVHLKYERNSTPSAQLYSPFFTVQAV